MKIKKYKSCVECYQQFNEKDLLDNDDTPHGKIEKSICKDCKKK